MKHALTTLVLSLTMGCTTVPMDGGLSSPATVKQSEAMVTTSIAIKNDSEQAIRVVSLCGVEHDFRTVQLFSYSTLPPCFHDVDGKYEENQTVTPESPYCYLVRFGYKMEHRRYENDVAAHSVKYLTLLPTPMTTWTTSASVRCEHHLQK